MSTSKIKAEVQAKEYIKQGFNGTKTIKSLGLDKGINSDKALSVKVNRMLGSDRFQIALREELKEVGIDEELLDKEMYKIIKQDKHLPTKLSAVVESNKMLGRRPKERNPQQHLHLHANLPQTNEELDQAIDNLQKELKELKNELGSKQTTTVSGS